MFFRVKRTGSYQYVQIAHSYRDNGQVKQQVICTLGRLEALQADGQLDKLMRSGLRFCEEVAVIDAVAKGQTPVQSIRRIGPDLVFGRLWEQVGIAAAVGQMLKGRRYDFDVERAIYLTVLHRLLVSGSDRAAEKWRWQYKIRGVEKLDLHHLYRAMAFLGLPLQGKQERVLKTPRCTKDVIEEMLFERRRDLFSEVDLVFFDTTSIYFEGAGGVELGQCGKSKDKRPDLKQMIVGVALDAEGWPLCCEMWPGNTTDVKTLLPVVERLKKRFGVRRMCVLGDRGMISKETIAALESSQPALEYILGARMRRQKEVSETVLRDRGRWQEVYPERERSKDPAPLKVRELSVKGRRYVVCLNEEERRKDAHDREAIVAHLREQLKQGDKSLVGNKGYRRYLKVEGEGHFAVDEDRIEDEARFDGMWVLRTNTDYEAETVALAYKQLWMVEDLFRTMKSILDTRPIYHKCDETIRGHVFCSFLALLLKKELEARLQSQGKKLEWGDVLSDVNELQEVETVFSGQRFALRSQLKGCTYDVLQAAGVKVPPSMVRC